MKKIKFYEVAKNEFFITKKGTIICILDKPILGDIHEGWSIRCRCIRWSKTTKKPYHYQSYVSRFTIENSRKIGNIEILELLAKSIKRTKI